VLATAFDAERSRFETYLPAPDELATLADDLRSAAREVRDLPAIAA
jgi:hypothetical protein